MAQRAGGPERSGLPRASDGGAVFIPHEFHCPITGDLLEDPVVAEDERSYSRQAILGWFAQCQRLGRPTTSPMTRATIGTRLVSNRALRQAIEEYKERMDAMAAVVDSSDSDGESVRVELPAADAGPVASVAELGQIFGQLDPLRDLLAQCLDGWQPPQLVAVGNEKSGKSTLLERLAMMPIFPHAEEICTRMRIQVRLRRGEARAPRLEVYNLEQRRTEGPILDVPMDSANIDMRDAMARFVSRQNGTLTGVTKTHMLILHVQSPSVPSLDLVDLPGVVTVAAAGEPDDMPQQTRELVDGHITENAAHSMFLCVVDATSAPNVSSGMELLKTRGVLDKTIGVITMCDYLGAPAQKTKLRTRLAQGGDAVPLEPHGYVATMNSPVEAAGASNCEKLQLQARAEPKFFRDQGYGDLVDADQATTAALMLRIEKMFLGYVKEQWVPDTLGRLNSEAARLKAANQTLGLPAAHGVNQDGATLQKLRQAASRCCVDVLRNESAWISAQYSSRVLQPLATALLTELESANGSTIPLQECETFVNGVRDRLLATCEAANRGAGGSTATITELLRTAFTRDTSSFKLARFPQLIDELIGRATRLLGVHRDDFAEHISFLTQHMSVPSPAGSVHLQHNFLDMTATVSMESQHIVGDVMYLFLKRLDVLPRPAEAVGQLCDCVDAIVKKVIVQDTTDSCNDARVRLLAQAKHVAQAQKGIATIASSGVMCSPQDADDWVFQWRDNGAWTSFERDQQVHLTSAHVHGVAIGRTERVRFTEVIGRGRATVIVTVGAGKMTRRGGGIMQAVRVVPKSQIDGV